MNKFYSFQEYVSEIDYTLFLEMAAAEANVKTHGGNPYLFTKHTQNFIHHFHPDDAIDALHWLHGEGLHEASKARHNAVGEYLKEKFPRMSEEDRWHEYNDVQKFLHDDPTDKIAKAIKELGEKYEKEGFLIKDTRRGMAKSYYEIKTLGEWAKGDGAPIIEMLKQEQASGTPKGLKGFSLEEIETIENGYFSTDQIKGINTKLSPDYKIGKRTKKNGRTLVSTKQEDIENNLKRKGWDYRFLDKDNVSKKRRYKVNPHFEQFMTNLEGKNVTRQDLLDIPIDDWNRLSDPDDEKYGQFHHSGGDYTHPTDPDEKNLDERDHKRIKKGQQAPPFLYSSGSAISRTAIEDAHKGALLGTALNVMGNHKESWTDHKGNEYEVEQRDYAHGSYKHFFIEATTSGWSSNEDRMEAFDDLKKKLEKLEEKMSHDHDDVRHFRWKIGKFVNGEAGSSILVDGPNSPNDISMWLSGSKKYDVKDHKFTAAIPKRPPVQALTVGWDKTPTRFSIVSSTGRLDHETNEVNPEGLQLPHISKDITYQELKTFKDEDQNEITLHSAKVKNETVNHPLLNNGSIMFKLAACLPVKRLVQLGIYRLKHKNEYKKRAVPEYVDADNPDWGQLLMSDLKMLGGQSSTSTNEGASEIFRHWKKLTPREQKDCTKQFSSAQLNFVRAMHPEDYGKLEEFGITAEEVKILADRSLTATVGGIGANGMKATQAHHPLHKYVKKEYMNHEYHALYTLAVGGVGEWDRRSRVQQDGPVSSIVTKRSIVQEQADSPEEEELEAQRQEAGAGQLKTPKQIMNDTINMHPGPVWKDAAIASYDYIKNAEHISDLMKVKLWPSFPSIVQHASLRIVENLKHRDIGKGFERIEEKKDGETIITFTYHPDPDGSKARQKEARKWLSSYVQLDHGTGTVRQRVSSGSVDDPMSDERATRSSVMSADQTKTHIEQRSGGMYAAVAAKPTHSWHDYSHGRHDNIRIQKGFLSDEQKIWAKNDEAIQKKFNEELAKWVNEKIASDKRKVADGADLRVFDPMEDDIPEQNVQEIHDNIMQDREWLAANPGLIGVDLRPEDIHRHKAVGQLAIAKMGPQDPGENLKFFKDLANGKAETKSDEANFEFEIGHNKFKMRSQAAPDWEWIDWRELSTEQGLEFINAKKEEAIVHGTRESDLNKHIKDIKNVLSGKKVSQSTVSDAPSDAEIEQYDTPSDAEISQYRTKIARIGSADSYKNSDRKMQSLNWINKQLEFATKMTDLNKKKIAIKNVEDYVKEVPGITGIGDYLNSFEESCENPTHGRLGIILELIRNKLNELQKLA